MDTEGVAYVKCQECKEEILEHDAIKVSRHTDSLDIEMLFCDEECSHDFYLRRMRELGM